MYLKFVVDCPFKCVTGVLCNNQTPVKFIPQTNMVQQYHQSNG